MTMNSVSLYDKPFRLFVGFCYHPFLLVQVLRLFMNDPICLFNWIPYHGMQLAFTLPFWKEVLPDEVLQIVQPLTFGFQRFEEQVGRLWLYFFLLHFYLLFWNFILVVKVVLVSKTEVVEVLLIREHVKSLTSCGEGVDLVGDRANKFELYFILELLQIVGLGNVLSEVVPGAE